MSDYTGCMACSPNPNIIALRAAYISAETELEKWREHAQEEARAKAFEVNRALAAERARDKAVAEVKFYKDREAHYSRVLKVTDGGQYRADWDGAIDRLLRERDEAVAALREISDHLYLGNRGIDGASPSSVNWMRETARRVLAPRGQEGDK